jgi:hypothetical protein
MKKIAKLLPLLCVMLFAASVTKAQLSISISVGIAPPALPVYVQPDCPTDGYLWVPGYWSYDNVGGYYWVPGYWAAPPNPGLLWTPAYWGFAGGYYGFHTGYWGAHVGFYGGINYGFGYGGAGFAGGNWVGGHFRYNTAVVNVNTTVIHNTYVDRTVINNVTVNTHTSFNGPGGATAKPSPQEQAAMREKHVQPTAAQASHQRSAAKDPSQFAKNNGGHPAAAAMNKIGGTPVNEHGKPATNSHLGSQAANHSQEQAKTQKTEAKQPATQHNAQQEAAKPKAQQRAVQHTPQTKTQTPAAQHSVQQSHASKPQAKQPHKQAPAPRQAKPSKKEK